MPRPPNPRCERSESQPASGDTQRQIGAKYSRLRGVAPSSAYLGQPLFINLRHKFLGKCKRTADQCRRPAKMSGCLCDSLSLSVDLQYFPNSNTMAKDIRFPTADRVAKPHARIFLFQSLFLQIETAQGGHLQMPALGLAGEQCRVILVYTAGLYNCRHW